MDIQVNLKPNQSLTPEKAVSILNKCDKSCYVYCWFVGPKRLPSHGAQFMTEKLILPLLERHEICLYSIEAWSFAVLFNALSFDTDMIRVIKSLNHPSLKGESSFEFFNWLASRNYQNGLLKEAICKKFSSEEWLINISDKFQALGITISDFYHQESTLLDCLKDWDLIKAYSCLQFLEGYFLVSQRVSKALVNQEKEVNVGFLLPGGEGKYYRDLSDTLRQWLPLDLGEQVNQLKIRIDFLFFKYRNNSDTRPYLSKEGNYISIEEMKKLFDFEK